MSEQITPIVEATHTNGNGHHVATPDRTGTARLPRTAHPIISIIIPTLNEEKLIEETLRNFGREVRERHAMELIVSDGGSHDRTVEIARHHADIVVQHTEKRRQTIAEGRNRGAERATGDLLVFINADTVPRDATTFFEELARIVKEHGPDDPTVAFACPVEVRPEERKWSDILFHGYFNNYVRLLNAIGIGGGRGECQVIWRPSFFSVGGYADNVAAGEDFDLYSRLARNGRIGHSWNLCVYESPRRFRRYGYLRVLASWTMNALAVMVLRRSISKEWEEVR